MTIQIENLSVGLDQFNLQNIFLDLPAGKIAVILGPSGSGKSVLLETVAGFYRPRSGRILLDGRDITLRPPEDRQIGFVFQDYALFPNRTVRENILFPLRFRKSADISSKGNNLDIRQITSMLRIEHLTGRDITSLSGGEKQRVALARALMSNPRVFLFDEPMSALDTRAKEELRIELGQLLSELSLTGIYVTHDQAEAAAFGDLICIMNNGRLAQTGSREAVFQHPNSPFVAKFVGMENLFEARVIDTQSESGGRRRVKVETVGPDKTATALTAFTDIAVSPGQKVFLGIRPEDVEIEPMSSDQPVDVIGSNVLVATVTNLVPWGVVYRVRLEGTLPLTAFLTQHQLRKTGLSKGKAVQVAFPPASLHLLRQSD